MRHPGILKSGCSVVNVALLLWRELLWLNAWKQEKRGQYTKDVTLVGRLGISCGPHVCLAQMACLDKEDHGVGALFKRPPGEMTQHGGFASTGQTDDDGSGKSSEEFVGTPMCEVES